MTQYISLLRFLGYGLLVLTLFDIISIFVPPFFMNSAWEFQAFSTLVDHTPVPLIGIGLVFYGEWQERTKLEERLLKYLSWLFLVIGVLFLLLLPLGISDAWRINNQNNAQIINQLSQQKSQLEQLKQQLNQASDEKIINFARRTNQNNLSVNNPQKLREEILTKFNQSEKQAQIESKTDQKNMFYSLLKTSIKLLLEELILGVLFIYTWRFTSWARDTS